MLKLSIWKLVIVGAVLAVLSAEAAAAEPTPPAKSDCPQECERRAKAAFAFAKLKAEAEPRWVPVAVPAPMPKAKGLCCCKQAPGGVGTCGSYLCPANGGVGGCECEQCQKTSALKTMLPETAKAAAPAPVAQPARARVIVGYSCGTDQYGRRVCVPVYEER